MSLSNKLIRAGVQSGTIMATADVITQYFVEEKHTMKQYDPTRTVRWGIAGLICHGPYFFIGFSAIDKYVVGKRSAAAASLAMVAKKTLVAQLVLFPPYLVLLFGLMGVLEGKSTQHEIIQKIRQRVPAAFIGGCVYWYVSSTCMRDGAQSRLFFFFLSNKYTPSNKSQNPHSFDQASSQRIEFLFDSTKHAGPLFGLFCWYMEFIFELGE